jgi:hypothetical protein
MVKTKFLAALSVCSLTPLLAQQPADVQKEIAGLQKKFVSLAEKMPADKYTWRPSNGVRSVSEVFLHVAGGNFRAASRAGVQPPEGASGNLEKTTTDKAKVVEVLRQSFDNLNKAASTADASKPLPVTMGNISHLHEHLGQSIAYARVNSVVPPWSEQ